MGAAHCVTMLADEEDSEEGDSEEEDSDEEEYDLDKIKVAQG